MLLPQEIIRSKRDGLPLTSEEIHFITASIMDGSFSDAQIAAFTMAVYFRGMTHEEIFNFAEAIAHSGKILKWDSLDLPGPMLDKHSTGGVGDKVSFILVPLVAACGGFIAKMSGRALGHSGGTLDKLESIPGYNATPTIKKLHQVVKKVGCAMIGQTAELAPVDKTIYAIRDVTATVSSIPLVTASILSKKFACQLDGLVLDVKYGNGALFPALADSIKLAHTLVAIANRKKLPIVALLTDMNQVLGKTVGNSLEVLESIDFLTGHYREPRLSEVVYETTSELLVLGKLAPDKASAKQLIQKKLETGAAAECFGRMVSALNGPTDLLEKPRHYLTAAPAQQAIFSKTSGFISKIDTRMLGIIEGLLGANHYRQHGTMDNRVGFSDVCSLGTAVDNKTPLMIVHAKSVREIEKVIPMLHNAFVIDCKKPRIQPLIRNCIRAEDDVSSLSVH